MFSDYYDAWLLEQDTYPDIDLPEAQVSIILGGVTLTGTLTPPKLVTKYTVQSWRNMRAEGGEYSLNDPVFKRLKLDSKLRLDGTVGPDDETVPVLSRLSVFIASEAHIYTGSKLFAFDPQAVTAYCVHS